MADKESAAARAKRLGMCIHGLMLGVVPACRKCLGGHRQDCAKFSMVYGVMLPRPCNCDRLDRLDEERRDDRD